MLEVSECVYSHVHSCGDDDKGVYILAYGS